MRQSCFFFFFLVVSPSIQKTNLNLKLKLRNHLTTIASICEVTSLFSYFILFSYFFKHRLIFFVNIFVTSKKFQNVYLGCWREGQHTIKFLCWWCSLRHSQKHTDGLIRIVVLKVTTVGIKQIGLLLKFPVCEWCEY